MNGLKRSRTYPYYVLIVLGAVCVLNYYDRNVLAIILQPMEKELGLTDTQAGLLSGVAFAAVYSLLGLPIARIADRGRRVKVLSAAVALWSVMTIACGFAVNALALFCARMGVGVGEAGGLPSTHAIIADYFAPDQRAKALSAIAIASSVGVVSGLAIGGFISDHYGWRAAFLVGGAPGLVLALLVIFSVREPGPWLVGREPEPVKLSPTSLRLAVRQLWGRSSYVLMVSGMTIASTAGYAVQAWTPTFLIRSFALKPGEVGVLYAFISAAPSIVGMLLGGLIMERWESRDRRASIWILLITFGAAVPIGLATFLAPTLYFAVAAIFVNSLVGAVYVGSSYALVQGLAGPKLRATGAAIYMAVINLFALSAGPALVGFLSDGLAPIAGVDSLRWALCLVCFVYVGSLPFLLLAARTVVADLDEAEHA